MSDDGLSVFQYDALATLNTQGPQKGLAIKTHLEDTHDRYGGEIHHGRLYPNLDDLVSRGYVAKGSVDGRTNEYALTAEGREVLRGRAKVLAGDTA